jgi:hypothetical protein
MKGRIKMTYKRSRGLAAMATVVIVAVCVAACGSSSSSSSSSSSAAAAGSATGSRAKLAACLKQHGVTLPPRPAGGRGYGPPPGAGNGNGNSSGGGGLHGGGFGDGRGRFNNPKFRAAFQACGAAAGFRGRRGSFRPSSAAIAKFASCVKQHGYTLPKANLSGKGPVYPVKIERDAKFQSASRACQSVLRPAGGGGTRGGASPAA